MIPTFRKLRTSPPANVSPTDRLAYARAATEYLLETGCEARDDWQAFNAWLDQKLAAAGLASEPGPSKGTTA